MYDQADDSDLPSPRTTLFGAHRPSTNPRIHAISKPYSRPNSYNDAVPGPSGTFGGPSNGSPMRASPTKQLASTRPGIPKSTSSTSLGGLPRSGSESSLSILSGIRSMLSKPLSWLVTPSRATASAAQGRKRDTYWDEEEPGTPTGTLQSRRDRDAKRLRRRSPSQSPPPGEDGDYMPDHISITGQAVTGTMLPPLPPSLSLASKRNAANGISSATAPNFSRPLKNSQSMPYLDPPGSMLSPVKPRGGIARSRGMDLSAVADEEASDYGADEGEQREQWSPWKERYSGRTRSSITPARQTPMRLDTREFGFPSASPFRAPYSPTTSNRQASSVTGVTRSATTSHFRRASTAASDISMVMESDRGLRHHSTLLNGNRDFDRMSVDGDRHAGSVTDWFMQDRWAPGSPASRAASMRLGSVGLGPASSMAPARKGQMVWDAQKGFVREHELQAGENCPCLLLRLEPAHPVHQNDAERILYELESMRKTPLTDARSTTSTSLPPNLVGSSSRSIRKAIAVPLATAQAGETARSRRDRDRLGDDHNPMISPYGRRKMVEREERDRRREARSQSAMDEDYRYKRSPSRATEAGTMASSRASVETRSEQSVTPSPTPSPAPTPRRSARNRKGDRGEAADDVTPKVSSRRTRSKRGKDEDETPAPEPTPRRRGTRRAATAEKATSPPPPQASKGPPPPVPTITETAPSPGHSTSTYRVRDDTGPREKSSLRVKSDTKRTHTSAVSSRATSPSSGRYSAREEDLPDMDELEQNKIQLPSFSGISFSGMSSTAPTPVAEAAKPAATPATPSNALPSKSTLALPGSSKLSAGPLSRLNSSRPRASSPLAAGSIVAEPASPPTTVPPAAKAPPKQDADGFFSLSSNTSSAPAPTTAPLFSNIPNDMGTGGAKKSVGFGLGKPSAPPATTGTGMPDFFGKTSAATSGTATPAPPAAPTFSFNLPTSSAAPPAATPTFNFGAQSKPADKPTESAPSGGSVFGGKAVDIAALTGGQSASSVGGKKRGADEDSAEEPAKKSAPFSFGTKPTEAPSNSFLFKGSSAPATEPKPPASTPFTFGTPSAAAAPPSEPPKNTFTFGLPAAPAAKPTEAGKPFTFGAPTPPVEKPVEPAKPAFNFGAPPAAGSASNGTANPPVSAAKPTFTFGAASAAAPSAAASTDAAKSTAPANPFGGFNFSQQPAKPATTAPASTPSLNTGSSGFNFGQPTSGFGAKKDDPAPVPGFGSAASTPAATATPQFNFGSSANPPAQANGSNPSSGFGSSAATGGGFGSNPPASAGGFGTGFGNAATAQPSQPTQSSGFGFGGGNASMVNGFGGGNASSGFGSSAPAPAQPTPASGGFNFNFSAPSSSAASTQGPASTFQFGAPTGAAPPATAPASTSTFNFGTPAPPSNQPFQFGVGASAPSTPAGGTSFNFGGAGATPQGQQGQQQPARFGSPAPPGGGGEGLFNIGAGGTATPGSPGGRRIKGLPTSRRRG